jgi:phenylacetate-CoA ligase
LLKQIISYSYRNVPHYRESFDRSGIKPDDVRSVDDLEKLPVLTKEEILAGYPIRMAATGYRPENSFRCVSSGTNGVRGEYMSDWSTRDTNEALLYRARSSFGFRPGHVECVFSFLPHKERWYERFGFLRKVDISMKEDPARALEELARLSPDTLYSVPTYLQYLCSQTGANRDVVSPLFVLTSGELLDPGTREELREAFQCPVVDIYGAAEAPYISGECPVQEGQHLNTVNVLVEICRDGEQVSPGERGDILITTLTNRAMPLIRYGIGDAGSISPEECSCGRHGEMLQSLEGRMDDFLKNHHGEVPSMMARLAVTHPKVEGYKIIQETLDRLHVQVMGEDVDQDAEAAIASNLRDVMGDPELRVIFGRVRSIEPDPSGKRRVVVCRA